jgi:hypothetical protein
MVYFKQVHVNVCMCVVQYSLSLLTINIVYICIVHIMSCLMIFLHLITHFHFRGNAIFVFI